MVDRDILSKKQDHLVLCVLIRFLSVPLMGGLLLELQLLSLIALRIGEIISIRIVVFVLSQEPEKVMM
jgi:hypothetical protein